MLGDGMTFDGAAFFFGVIKWLGWAATFIGAVYLLIGLVSSQPGVSTWIAASMLGCGLSAVVLGIIGQMMAAIAEESQRIRRLAEQHASERAQSRN